MKLVAMVGALLALVGQQAPAAAQTVGTTYTVIGSRAANGSGCIAGAGGYYIVVRFQYLGPGNFQLQELKVQFGEQEPWPNQKVPVCANDRRTTGEVVYNLATDNPLQAGKFGIDQFTPNSVLIIHSSGLCGAKGQPKTAATIRATITNNPNEVTIECLGLNYSASGASKPPISFK